MDAITHDDNNYVVMADKVTTAAWTGISPCPTGSIDNWRLVSAKQSPTACRAAAGLGEPAEELSADALAAAQTTENAGDAGSEPGPGRDRSRCRSGRKRRCRRSLSHSQLWRHHRLVCRPMPTPICMVPRLTATVVGNLNCTEAGFDNERPATSCWTSVPCLSRCSKVSRWVVPPGVGMPAAKPSQWRASTRLPVPAMASAPATTIWH